MIRPAARRASRLSPVLIAIGGALAGLTILMLSLLAGYGWLYGLRGAGWLAAGPRVTNSLPLLQLAGSDGQPLLRIVVAWLFAGLIAGVALIRVRPVRRAAIALGVGLVLLLLAAQAAEAVTRNLRFSHVILGHDPGIGPVLEALLFAIGCALPRSVLGSERTGRRSRAPVRRLGFVGDGGLRRGQHRHAAEYDRDRHEVGGDGQRARA